MHMLSKYSIYRLFWYFDGIYIISEGTSIHIDNAYDVFGFMLYCYCSIHFLVPVAEPTHIKAIAPRSNKKTVHNVFEMVVSFWKFLDNLP